MPRAILQRGVRASGRGAATLRTRAAPFGATRGERMRSRCWLVAAAVSVLLPAATNAQGLAGRFIVAAQIGTQSEVAGDLLKSASGTLLDRPVTIDSVRYRDVYAP